MKPFQTFSLLPFIESMLHLVENTIKTAQISISFTFSSN